ncbi:MAG TPA: crosslink repair DNA glycosylase YcaQ family protein [Blastocatellia bacterium]|nr:crosslink repair DNA glycosylase YcaQ family protein [Blastocatellia bacterium]
MTIKLSLPEARRVAVSSQGFGPRPSKPSIGHLRKLAARLYALQIDSVNVLVRAHYLPAFARLGPYPTDALDSLAYSRRELFEYWGHAACLMPISLYPIVRYRMERHAERMREYLRSEQGAYMAKVHAEVTERGPLAAAELSAPGKRSGNWWNWGVGKMALEQLYDAGLIAIAGRRGFERLYDLTERVIPRAVLEAPVPPREEAMKQLICFGAKACGVGTFGDLTDYFRTDGWHDRMAPGPWGERQKGRAKPVAKRLVSELVEEGRLLAAHVEGWREPAYLPPGTRIPKDVDARAFVTPFDSLVWDRSRLERLFGMKYTIELYVPAPKRVYGYYVCPFLLGDTLVARCDLKADRARKVLMVQSAFIEPGQNARRVVPDLAGELRQLQAWLELDRIEVAERGDLAAKLRRSVRP